MLSETDYLFSMEQGDRESARLLFSGQGDYKDCHGLLKELTYEDALSCMARRTMKKLRCSLTLSPDYPDACDQSVSARLALAGQLYGQGDYKLAVFPLKTDTI